nr:MAG TPA: hypothetical protein [Bacteriophage sp.]
MHIITVYNVLNYISSIILLKKLTTHGGRVMYIYMGVKYYIVFACAIAATNILSSSITAYFSKKNDASDKE